MSAFVLAELECIDSGSRFEWQPAAEGVAEKALPYTEFFDSATAMLMARMLPAVTPPEGARFYLKGSWRPVDVTDLVLAAHAREA